MSSSFARKTTCFVLVFVLLALVEGQDPTVSLKRPPSFWHADLQALVFPALSYASLECDVTNLPRFGQVRWRMRKDSMSMVLMEGVTKVTPFTYRLTLTPGRPLLPQDDGWTYACEVQISAQQYVSDAVLVRVVEAPVIAQLASSNDQEVMEGDSVRLVCDARAHPPADVTWSRVDGQPINGAPEVKSKTVDLSRVRPSDAGQFRCRAENMAGHVDRVVSLTVRYYPRVTVVTSSVSTSVGNDVTLTCNVKTVPPAIRTSWSSAYHGDIQESNRYVLQRTNSGGEEQTMTLTLKAVTLTDAGNYTCTAMNLLGFGSDVITLQVTQP